MIFTVKTAEFEIFSTVLSCVVVAFLILIWFLVLDECVDKLQNANLWHLLAIAILSKQKMCGRIVVVLTMVSQL